MEQTSRTRCTTSCCNRRPSPTTKDAFEKHRAEKPEAVVDSERVNNTKSTSRASTHRNSANSWRAFLCTQQLTSNCRVLSALFVFLALANCATAFTASRSECDPDDIYSCQFGAVCMREYGRTHNTILGKPVYRCKCPKINCRRAGLLDPVCGRDGKHKMTYFNEVCLLMAECEKQKAIERVCYGACQLPTCKAISAGSEHHGPCPREQVSLCMNGGLCMHHKASNESFCRCPAEFHGERCEFRSLETKGDEKPCDSTQQILTIFALILLAVVLLSLLACICWRNKNRKGQDEEDKLWSRSNTEHEETTPLRESARSDFMFPSRDRLGGGSSN